MRCSDAAGRDRGGSGYLYVSKYLYVKHLLERERVVRCENV
jgi:hypothetical protein